MNRIIFTRLAAVALLGLGSALAAPFLGSKASFVTSPFCKAHKCQHVGTVPSGYQDQFHYVVDGQYSVVVWRTASDVKRLWGPEAAAYAGQVRGVDVVWYGIQDGPFGAEGFLSQLLGFATGRTASKAMAADWLSDRGTNRAVGDFVLRSSNRVLPGANAAMKTVSVEINPFR